jgi:hypothetical protein
MSSITGSLHEDSSREVRRRLVETYALRAREYSDAVASLPWSFVLENKFQETLAEVKRLRELCEEAAAQLFEFNGQQPQKSNSSNPPNTDTQPAGEARQSDEGLSIRSEQS